MAVLLILLSLLFPVFAETVDCITPANRESFVLNGQGISLPLGYFLLVRKGDDLAAIRLTAITPHTAAAPRAAEWIGKVSYETYFITGSNASFHDSLPVKQTGELTYGRVKGFGFHYSWQSGNHVMPAGPWKFLFFHQDGMYMTSVSRWNGIAYDAGLEFAPTSSCEILTINPQDSRLVWYRRDPNRENVKPSLDQLPAWNTRATASEKR